MLRYGGFGVKLEPVSLLDTRHIPRLLCFGTSTGSPDWPQKRNESASFIHTRLKVGSWCDGTMVGNWSFWRYSKMWGASRCLFCKLEGKHGFKKHTQRNWDLQKEERSPIVHQLVQVLCLDDGRLLWDESRTVPVFFALSWSFFNWRVSTMQKLLKVLCLSRTLCSRCCSSGWL